MKINLVNSQAVKAMVDFVSSERKAGRKVSRGSLLVGLGYDSSKITAALKSAVSAFLDSGEVPELKLVQKEGVVPADYRRGADVRKETVEKNKAERAEKKVAAEAEKENLRQEKLKAKGEKESAKRLEAEQKASKSTETTLDETVEVAA